MEGCEWAQEARVFHHPMLERLARDKHASLLGPFNDLQRSQVTIRRIVNTTPLASVMKLFMAVINAVEK